MAKDAGQTAAKWVRRMQGSGEEMRAGVNAVTENPAAKAIEKQDKMVARWLDSVNNGKWRRGLEPVTLASWKRDMTEKGIPRAQQGAAAAEAKVAAFHRELGAYQDQGLLQLNDMPDQTLQDSIGKMVFWVNHMANFRREG